MNRRIKILIIIFGAFLTWLLLAPVFAEVLIVEKSLEKADAILVLGGSSTYVERTNAAAELFKKGAAAKILLTDDGENAGWSKTEKRNPLYVELALQNLTANGVAQENIEILQPEVSGTIYEARVLAEKTKTDNLRSILIVTSAYHTRRSLQTFERHFAKVDLPVEFGIFGASPGFQTPKPFWWWLSPRGWNLVAGEYVKIFYYRLAY